MGSSSSDQDVTLYGHSNHKERFEVEHYIIKRLGGGNEGEVYVSVPKDAANQIFSDLSEKKITKDAACQGLRAALQAVKITNASNVEDCRNEITAPQNLGNGRSHVARLLNADVAEAGWLTTELLTGGALDAFKLKVNTGSKSKTNKTFQPSIAFGWHLVHDLTVAFLELHFGIVNGTRIAGSERYVHHDTSAQDLAFRVPGPFNDYPDLVLIDLGKAVRVDEENRGGLLDMRKAQVNDVVVTAGEIKNMFSKNRSDDCDSLKEALARLDECYTEEIYGTNRNEGLQDLLIEIRDEAFEERQAQYQPLDSEMATYFSQEVASDDELLAPMESTSGSGSGSSPRGVVRAGRSSSPPKQRGLSKRHILKNANKAKRQASP